jgi:hypothetical protein
MQNGTAPGLLAPHTAIRLAFGYLHSLFSLKYLNETLAVRLHGATGCGLAAIELNITVPNGGS